MKQTILIICVCLSTSSFAQDKDMQQKIALDKAKDLVYEANTLVDSEDYVSAEMEYRKAISQQPNFATGTYNLGHSYYKNGHLDEALYRNQQTAKHATSKDEKFRAFHNIGNILMQSKKCKEASEAFKNALRNNPTDDETRYNYVLAKECADQQQDQEEDDQDENEDKEEDNKEQEQQEDKEQEDENKENKPEEEGDQDDKEGEDQEDEEGKPKDEKEDQGKEGEEKKDKPQPQPGQLSPQQIKNLLEAMNDQEQKVQDKINEQKQKGAKIQTEKDW